MREIEIDSLIQHIFLRVFFFRVTLIKTFVNIQKHPQVEKLKSMYNFQLLFIEIDKLWCKQFWGFLLFKLKP